jgi:hypothetical protein
MSTSVALKVSAQLAQSIRAAAEASDRSMAGQIEHWAKLGRAAEEVMPAPVVAALKKSEGHLHAIPDESMRQRVLEAMKAFRTLSFEEKRSAIGLDQKDLYEPDPEEAGAFIRVSPDGSRTRGRIQARKFVPLP